MLARSFLRASRPAARAFSTTAWRPLAKMTLIGNLGESPQLEATSTGREIIKYSIASNSGPKDNRQTSWWNITAFIDAGARRDFLLSLDKGSTVYVEADARMDTFTDSEGRDRKALNMVHRSIEVLKRPQSAHQE